MKIVPKHYAHIKNAMREKVFLLPAIKSHIRCATVPPKDLDMRIRWDLFYAAEIGKWVCDNVYCYATDDHLDTALRQIMEEIQ